MSSPGPRRAWYGLSAAVFVASLVTLFGGLWWVFSHAEAMPRVRLPGTVTVDLPRGDGSLFFERKSVIDGVDFAYRGDGQVACQMRGPDGADVALRIDSGSTRYTSGSYVGELMFEFETMAAGAHVLTCTATDGQPFVFAVSTQAILPALLGTMFGSVGLFMASVTLSLLTFFRRRWARNAPVA